MKRKPLSVPPGYEVTRDGRVFSLKRGERTELKQWRNGSGHGYPCVYVYVDGVRRNYAVYRLVAAAHLPPRPSMRHFVLHTDGDRLNSHADNLRWGTASENMHDAWRHRRLREVYALPLDELGGGRMRMSTRAA